MSSRLSAPSGSAPYLPVPRLDGRSCFGSPATATLLARNMDGTPFSTYIWEASSNISRSNSPISSGSISETASGVISQMRMPPRSS